MTTENKEDQKVYKYKDTEIWFLNGKIHRDDNKPALSTKNFKGYFKNGVEHRLDGPAIEFTNGYKEWWINGRKCSEEDFYKIKSNL
jgi:hypothetical protein